MSFDGSFSQRFENTQFTVSLPIINGLGSSELRNHMPKRGDNSSKKFVGKRRKNHRRKGRNHEVYNKASSTASLSEEEGDEKE